LAALAAANTAGVSTTAVAGWPETIWAMLGAAAVVLLGLLPGNAAPCGSRARARRLSLLVRHDAAVGNRAAGRLFDWLAVEAVIHARGSPQWLFLLVYGVGTLVTVFMSNDARGRPITPQTARPADRECESVVDCHGDTADVRASGLSPQQYRANASLPDRQVCS